MQEEKREVAPNRYPILNTYVNALSMDETVDYVKRVIARRTPPVQHVVINALKVNLMEKDPELREIVNSCPLINADGASILWAAQKLGVPVTERVTGIDLFMRLVEEAVKNGTFSWSSIRRCKSSACATAILGRRMSRGLWRIWLHPART